MLRAIGSLRIPLYLAYGLVLTAVLVYVRFPAAKFRQYCESSIERVLPDTSCSIDRIDYRFPATVRFSGITLGRTTDGNRSEWIIDHLAVSPAAGKLMREFAVTGTFYSGVWSTRMGVDFTARQFTLKEILLDGLDTAALTASLNGIERKIVGKIGFTGSYQATVDDPGGGTGQGRMVVSDGSFALLQPVLSLTAIDFRQLTFETKFTGRRLDILDGKVQGNDITADFSGGLALTESFVESNLQLSGQMTLQADFLANHPEERKMVQGLLRRYNRSTLPFKVGGTMIRPTFRFGM
jgi:type II secretion system protein N